MGLKRLIFILILFALVSCSFNGVFASELVNISDANYDDSLAISGYDELGDYQSENNEIELISAKQDTNLNRDCPISVSDS